MSKTNKLVATGQQLVVRIIDGEREYKVFANGEVEGFGQGVIVANYLPYLLATANQERDCLRRRRSLRSPMTGEGDAHMALPCDSQ